jgi:hypothetical protein
MALPEALLAAGLQELAAQATGNNENNSTCQDEHLHTSS